MKRRFLLLSLGMAIAFLFLQSLPAPASEWARVRWVEDGDTIVLEDGRRVRYIGINAPEVAHEDRRAEPFGNAAKAFNKQRVDSRQIKLAFDLGRYDQYNRLLAYVYLADGTFLNAAILEAGYAYFLPTPPNLKYSSVLLSSQRQAMALRKGIWNKWKERGIRYVGNLKSMRFHTETCVFGKKISRKNRIIFERQWDAYWEGLAPCKKCISK
jgi:micrococcal nuclease